MSGSGLQDTQTATLWLPGSTPPATKSLFGDGIDIPAGFCHPFLNAIVAPDPFRHVFGPCGPRPTGGCRKAISYHFVSEGGVDKDNAWRNVNFFDTKKLRKKWQYHVLMALKKAVRGTAYAASWYDNSYLDQGEGRGLRMEPEPVCVRTRTGRRRVA